MMIEISESKVEKMSDYAEKMLKYGGKLMQCIEELSGGEDVNVIMTMTTTAMTRWVNVVIMVAVPVVAAMAKDAAYVVQDAIPVIVNV